MNGDGIPIQFEKGAVILPSVVSVPNYQGTTSGCRGLTAPVRHRSVDEPVELAGRAAVDPVAADGVNPRYVDANKAGVHAPRPARAEVVELRGDLEALDAGLPARGDAIEVGLATGGVAPDMLEVGTGVDAGRAQKQETVSRNWSFFRIAVRPWSSRRGGTRVATVLEMLCFVTPKEVDELTLTIEQVKLLGMDHRLRHCSSEIE